MLGRSNVVGLSDNNFIQRLSIPLRTLSLYEEGVDTLQCSSSKTGPKEPEIEVGEHFEEMLLSCDGGGRLNMQYRHFCGQRRAMIHIYVE